MTTHTGTEITITLQSIGLITSLEHYGTVLEKKHLFLTFLLHTLEVLLMSRAKASEDAYRGLNDTLQSFHLARLAYSCFKDANLAAIRQLPYAQRHAYL